MKRILLSIFLIALSGLPASAQKDENNRIRNSGKVMVEILNVPDDIPQRSAGEGGMRHRAAFGFEICDWVRGELWPGRDDLPERQGLSADTWSAPSMMALEGGSFGLQLGGQATDFVLLVMNQRGADSLLTSQVKLGGDMAAAAGPKGRSAAASTDATLRAEILSYSRSRGLFAGISLKAQRSAPITTATRGSTEKERKRRTS